MQPVLIARAKRLWLCVWKGLKNSQWIAIGTWVLAIGTIGLWLDARSTSERQLRAYVFAAPYRAFNIDSQGAVAQVYTIVGSKGSTFARKVERSVGISILSGPVPEKFEDLGPLRREEGVFVLAPGAEGFVIQNLHVLSADELAKLMTPKGELRIYAFGKITYEDAFGGRHTTTFCHAYFGPASVQRQLRLRVLAGQIL